MAGHCDEKCRRCSCQRRSCQRRRAEKRRQAWRLTHRPRLLLGPTSGALFQYWRSQYPVVDKEPPFKADAVNEPYLQADEVAIDSEDLRVMRDSVDNMQQLLQRGLRDIQEIRDLVKQAAARRASERQDVSVPRATMETEMNN